MDILKVYYIGKKTAFKAFTEATPAELSALSQLGIEEMPSADVVSGCEEVFARVFFVQAPSHKKRPKGQHI